MISIVIINWNTKDLLLRCIDSVYEKNHTVSYEIILVDNASSDDSVLAVKERFPKVKIICNDYNVGYAAANNQGLQIAKGEVFLLLNSDTELVSSEPLSFVEKYFNENSRVAVIGCKLVFPDGRIQSVGREFLSLKLLVKQQIFFSGYFQNYKLAVEPQSVDYVDGAFLAVRSEIFRNFDGLNEEYFLYGEDMEFCWRVKQAGWLVHVLPQISVRHYHAASSKKDFSNAHFNNVVNNCRFLQKKYDKNAARKAYLVYGVGTFLRIPLAFIRKTKLAKHYLNVLLKMNKTTRKKIFCL